MHSAPTRRKTTIVATSGAGVSSARSGRRHGRLQPIRRRRRPREPSTPRRHLGRRMPHNVPRRPGVRNALRRSRRREGRSVPRRRCRTTRHSSVWHLSRIRVLTPASAKQGRRLGRRPHSRSHLGSSRRSLNRSRRATTRGVQPTVRRRGMYLAVVPTAIAFGAMDRLSAIRYAKFGRRNSLAKGLSGSVRCSRVATLGARDRSVSTT